MKRVLAIAFAAGVLAACASPDSRTAALSIAHAAAIRDSVRAMLRAFQRYSANRQWDSVATLYVADSTLRWIENGRVVMCSSAALEHGLGSLPKTTSIETIYDTLEVTPVAPGVASALAHYHTTFKDSTRGNATFGGLLTMIIVHRPRGWQFLSGHTSTPPKS
jgi:hypothetical protein